MQEVNRRFLLLDAEPLDQLSLRLKRQKAPDFVVIDSFQYTQMTYAQYIRFKEQHRNKLLIFISHASGKNPDGRSAKKVAFDASLKIYVEGYRLSPRDGLSVLSGIMIYGRKKLPDIVGKIFQLVINV